MNKQKAIDDVVAKVGDLPAIPEVVGQIIEMMGDPQVSMSELSEQIQRDPALTAKILKISNSAYYGMRQYVSTLKLALVVLGVREVRNIVTGIAVFDTFRDTKADVLMAEGFWRHSLDVASFSKGLGNAMALGLQGEDFIAGLLHDIGKMVLSRCLGEPYIAVLRASAGDHFRLSAAENETFGFTHADAATALAARWNLPESLCDAIYCHHAGPDRPLTEARDPKLAAIVRIANLMAYQNFEVDEGAECRPCTDYEAWNTLASARTPLPPDRRHGVLATIKRENKTAAKTLF